MRPLITSLRLVIYFRILVFVSSNTYAAQTCVGIDGPANLRSGPNGEIIGSIPDHSTVWTDYPLKLDGDWHKVRFARKNAKSPIRCSTSGERTHDGWVHKKNVKADTPVDITGPVVFGSNWDNDDTMWDSSLKHYSIEASRTCICSYFGFDSWSDDGVYGPSQVEYQAAEPLPGDCIIHAGLMRCRIPGIRHVDYTYCPLKCVTSHQLPILTDADRKNRLSAAGGPLRERLRAKIGERFILGVEKKYPEWIPLIVPHPKHDTQFFFDRFKLISSWGQFSFSYRKNVKNRTVLVFFANSDDGVAQKPTLAFENNEGDIEFRKIPFSLRDTGKIGRSQEDVPSLCIQSIKEIAILRACRDLGDISPEIGAVDFGSDPVKASGPEANVSLGLEGPCCSLQGDEKVVHKFKELDP